MYNRINCHFIFRIIFSVGAGEYVILFKCRSGSPVPFPEPFIWYIDPGTPEFSLLLKQVRFIVFIKKSGEPSDFKLKELLVSLKPTVADEMFRELLIEDFSPPNTGLIKSKQIKIPMMKNFNLIDLPAQPGIWDNFTL